MAGARDANRTIHCEYCHIPLGQARSIYSSTILRQQVEEKKERRKVVAELLKSLTGTQKPLAGETPRRVVSRGAQHSELLRWIIVYSERIRELILDEQTREVAVREGEAASKVYNVTFGEERQVR